MIPKFRAWDENGKRYEGNEVCLIGELVIKSSYSATRWEEEAQLFNLCQSTGLKDKNGKEIYNHQKVLVDSPKGAFEAKVVFEHGGFGIVATKGRVCDYFEASWIDDFVPFIDLYVIENCEEDTLWMVEVAE